MDQIFQKECELTLTKLESAFWYWENWISNILKRKKRQFELLWGRPDGVWQWCQKSGSVFRSVHQIFREEYGLQLRKLFSFVHLSVQKFLADSYSPISFILENKVLEELGSFQNSKKKSQTFLKCRIDKSFRECEWTPGFFSYISFCAFLWNPVLLS